MSQLPVDAHEEVGEETFVEAQLAALFNVRKADDEYDQVKFLADGRIKAWRMDGSMVAL